jgi:hypothetical protein
MQRRRSECDRVSRNGKDVPLRLFLVNARAYLHKQLFNLRARFPKTDSRRSKPKATSNVLLAWGSHILLVIARWSKGYKNSNMGAGIRPYSHSSDNTLSASKTPCFLSSCKTAIQYLLKMAQRLLHRGSKGKSAVCIMCFKLRW